MTKTARWNKFLSLWVLPSIVIRVVVPLFIFVNPIFVTAVTFATDWLDSGFYYGAKIKKSTYQLIDKTLDLYWYGASLYFLFSFNEFPFKKLLTALFIFRLLGQVLFYLTKQEKYFLIFPNFYENIFIFALLIETIPSFGQSFTSQGMNSAIIFLFVLKFVQEIILHTGREYYAFLPRWMRGPR